MSRTPEFTAALAAFKTARDRAAGTADEAYAARQRHQKISRQQAAMLRQGDARFAEELQRKLASLSDKSGHSWTASQRADAVLLEHLRHIESLLDPREHADELDDAVPVLLMPLRIEARFAPVADELWVRAFPDSWAVDGFEPMLSDTEVANAQAFWADFWAAGDGRDMQVAVWRNLVASHGEGRSAWIVARYRPLNEADRPGAAPAGTLTMAIDGAPPAPAPAEAIRRYWQTLWRHPGDADAKLAAITVLEQALGHAAATDVAARPPRRFDDAFSSARRDTVTLRLVWIEWPVLADHETKSASWTQGARTDMLPERLVVTLQQGENRRSEIGSVIPPVVRLGFDPAAPDVDQFKQVDGELELPEAIAWIFDFDKAVAMGLGLRIALVGEERSRGFDRLIVAGLCLRDTAEEGRGKLQTLIAHHAASKTGISLLQQGVATNNADKDSGWTVRDDVAGSFTRIFEGAASPFGESDPTRRLDGQWLAQWLGIDPTIVTPLANATGRDQLEARAINTALWPATVGYALDSLLDGVVGDAAQAATRRYFGRYVLARDCVPQLRIGDQPYGILPASAWSRQRWFVRQRRDGERQGTVGAQAARFLEAQFGTADYPAQLYAVLRIADSKWTALVPGAAHMARPGELHQTLLDILGLAPNSLEFHRRNADSMEQFFNLMRAHGLGGLFQAMIANAKNEAALQLLRDMGYQGADRPQLLRFVFHGKHEKLGPLLVDDAEPSERDPIRAYTDDGRNYLRWLIDASGASLDALRVQQGFSDDEIPSALLYHLARHALQLGYQQVGIGLLANAPTPLLDPAQRRAARRDAPFMHIAADSAASESRYYHLYQPAPSITGNAAMLLQEHVATILGTAPEARGYRDIVAALELLVDTPTARLERLLTEHLDLCTYRLDAWKQGMLQLQLEFMREHHPARPMADGEDRADGQSGQGLYLGAYGWLEDLRPRASVLSAARVPSDLAAAFASAVDPLVEDPDNLGYIHAPSLDQAQTAAVLRNSYVANADPAHPGTMAINLSSWRVRQAMGVLEGMRNDQSLGELLGYRLERELHGNFALAETDAFIFALRRHFPLVANRIATTYQDLPAGESIETIEARNVVDGAALLRHIRAQGNASYPFGLANMPAASATQRTKIDAAIDLVANVSDAVADLALAESVHQAMKGKPDSAAAVLDAQGSGLFPPVSEFVATPREGQTLTLRTGLFLDPSAPGGTAWAALAATPRSEAEPVLNHWLASIFPAPADVIVEVEDVATATRTEISLAGFGRQPIDWLYDLRLDDPAATSALDLLIEAHYRAAHAPVDARAKLAIRYRADAPGKISLFRFAPLVDTARTLLTTARPLVPSDIALNSQKAADRTDTTSVLPAARAAAALTALDTLATDLAAFAAPLASDLADRTANAASIRSSLQARLAAFAALAERAARFGMTELDPAIGLRWSRRWFIDLETRLDATMADWERRLAEFAAYVARFDATPLAAPFGDIYAPLQRAERQISTAVTQPLPADPAAMRADLLTRRQAFADRLGQLRTAQALVTDDADAYLAQLETALPLSAFVPEDFSITADRAAFAVPTEEMASAAKTLLIAIAKRQVAATASLADHDAAGEPAKRVAALAAALKAIFGDAFVSVPLFTLGEAQQAELALCAAAQASLLAYQTTTVGDPLPLETWLHSSARVRERMAGFEYLGFLTEALSDAELPLNVWQLPHAPGDHWLGSAYPEGHGIDGDRLLFHAHHAAPFDPTAAQAGLLLDEWTEVIPTRDILSGVAFHFDRPNSEPPQAFLLMTPTDFRGGWSWADIVDGLNETLDTSKQRAVEPAQIDGTAFAPLLPATLAATVHHPLSIALNYAAVNGFARLMVEGAG